MTLNKYIEPTRFIVWIIIGLLAVGAAYAKITDRISVVEEKVCEIKSDHDLLITIGEKVISIEADVKELKEDVKRFTRR